MQRKPRICFVSNHPSHYRLPIYRLMEDAFDVEWHFSLLDPSIKAIDPEEFRSATIHKATLLGKRKTKYWQHGIAGLASRTDADTFLMLGEPNCLSTWIAAWRIRLFHPSKRVYFWAHGWYGNERGLRRCFNKLFFRAAHGIFTYGRRAKELMVKEGFDAGRIFVIHNSLDHQAQLQLRGQISRSDILAGHFGNADVNLIFIGRLTQVKRLDLAIEALARLNAGGGRRYTLTIVGNGEQAALLLQQAARLGQQDNVWLYGECYDQQTNARLITEADICVSPGNVGLTAMHAMVFGTPVITHDNLPMQMPEFEAVRPGLTGDFFSYGDAASLARTIERWVDTHPDRRAVSQACCDEIDSNWTPQFQLNALKQVIR